MSAQPGWRKKLVLVGTTVGPLWFVLAGFGLGAGSIVQNQPLVGACGAIGGATAALLYQRRARFHQAHSEALRDRLRTHRAESEQVAAELRQAVSGLQTELWRQRMVALATPAYGISLPAGDAVIDLPDDTPGAEAKPADGTSGVETKPPTIKRPVPFAQAG